MNQKIFSYMTILLTIASLAAGIYILSLGPEAGPDVVKIGFGCGFIILACFLFAINRFCAEALQALQGLMQRSDNLEKILVDARGGARVFFKERRRFVRAKTPEGLNARITGKDVDSPSKVLDISRGGALLRTSQKLMPGEKIHLNIPLPLFPRPVDTNAMVVRVVEPQGESAQYNVGVEFLDVSLEDRKKLQETVQRLLESQNK